MINKIWKIYGCLIIPLKKKKFRRFVQNELKTIESDLFYNLQKLNYLSISGNKIKEIGQGFLLLKDVLSVLILI